MMKLILSVEGGAVGRGVSKHQKVVGEAVLSGLGSCILAAQLLTRRLYCSLMSI